MRYPLLLFTLYFLLSTIYFSSHALAEQNIRVAVIRDAPEFNLSIRGPYHILTLQTDEILISDRSLRQAKVYPNPSGLKIGPYELKIYGVKIKPEKEATIYINGRRFRGQIAIIRTPQMHLLVVNYINIEDYLYGVLCEEVSHRWSSEALKAQAVASRTFALYQSKVNTQKDYDLTADIYSQVYGGRSSERYRANKAVDRTRNLVLTYQGELFPAYYHATCGGQTEDATQLWKIDLPPLKGVRCSFCRESPHCKWTKELSLLEIENNLRKNGHYLGKIQSISVISRNNSNRVSFLEIKDKVGTIQISGKDFRQTMGSNLIRSTNFTVILKSDSVIFEGLGWGHGVGMCQWGANFMARQGYKYDQILKYYYPGTEIKHIDEPR
jgi:stage II sporulation protein D